MLAAAIVVAGRRRKFSVGTGIESDIVDGRIQNYFKFTP